MSLSDYTQKIFYSDRYSDDEFEYRHVILPKGMMKLIPDQYFESERGSTLRLLEDDEWRGLGIQQSLGWVHFSVHAPEPHIVSFRRSFWERTQARQLMFSPTAALPSTTIQLIATAHPPLLTSPAVP